MDNTRLYIEHRQGRQHVVLLTWCGKRPSFQVNEYISGFVTKQWLYSDRDEACKDASILVVEYEETHHVR